MQTEFEFIEKLRNKYSLTKIGDDCAVLPKDDKTDMVVTADMLIEDIDFRLGWCTPEFLGHKALAVSLSDIAAMGAEPKWAMLSLGIPENLWNTDFVSRIYAGWMSMASEFEVELVGGDISRTPDKIVVDSIAGGEVPKGKAILRSGAQRGDLIFVAGELGGAAAGLLLLENKIVIDNVFLTRELNLTLQQLQPEPQLDVSNLLQQKGIATSMLDLSDGLSSDLSHLCDKSRVGARIYADKIPIESNLEDLPLSPDEKLALALNGGEDFKLLFTINKKDISALSRGQYTCIGEITPNIGNIELIRDGKSEILLPKGYRHF